MSSDALSASFERLRKISKITALVLTKNVNKREKIASVIYLIAVYLYCALFFSRKFSLQNEVEDYIYAIGLLNGIKSDNMLQANEHFPALPRSTLMRVNRAKLADLLILMENPEEHKMKRAGELRSELGRQLAVVGRYAIALEIVTYVVSILGWLLTDKENMLPFGSMPRWIMDYNYTACFVFQVILFAFIIGDYILSDVIKICILLQLRMHFKYLRLSVEEVLDDAKEEFCLVNKISTHLVRKTSVPWVFQQRQLKNIIAHHNYITRIARETEEVFNKCVLASFVNVSFFICIILFRIANAPLFTVEFWKLSLYIIAISTLMFADCYYTQRVITENEALSYSCYKVDFVGTNIQFQKSLVLIMARAQRPVRFTIGKFAPVGVVTIVTILKAAYSYFTLLQNRHKQ